MLASMAFMAPLLCILYVLFFVVIVVVGLGFFCWVFLPVCSAIKPFWKIIIFYTDLTLFSPNFQETTIVAQMRY